jgi:uncharacterized membrane protein
MSACTACSTLLARARGPQHPFGALYRIVNEVPALLMVLIVILSRSAFRGISRRAKADERLKH